MINGKKNGFCCFVKSMLFLLTAFCVFAFSVPETADAFSNEINFIGNVDFKVDIEKDGSAVIDESWLVACSGDSREQSFHRMVERPCNQLEYYEEAEIIKSYVDDNEVVIIDDETDTENDCFLYSQDEFFCIDDFIWNVESDSKSHTYKTEYKIKDLVKLDENGKAVFSFDFIDDEFYSRIFVRSAKVTINLPGKDKNAEIAFYTGDYDFNGKTLTAVLDKPSGLLKCSICTEPDIFNSIKKYSDVVLPDEKDFDNSEFEMTNLILYVPVVIFALIFLLIFLLFKNVLFKKVNVVSYLLDQTLLKNQSKVSRWIFLGCLVLVISLVIYGNNTYQIPAVDLKTELLPDGSAEITETWTVEYKNGEYKEFSKDFPKLDSQLMYYDDIDILSCSINGVEAKLTVPDDDTDYTYYFEKNKGTGSNFIHWNYKPSKETVFYSIKYRLKDAVKYYYELDEAVFGYQFFGDNVKKNAKIAKLVIGPLSDDSEIGEIEENEDLGYFYYDNYLYGYSHILKKGFDFIAPTSPEYFDDLKDVDDVEVPALVKFLPKKENKSISKWDALDIISFMEGFVPAAAVVYIIAALIVSNVIYFKKKKKNPGFLYKAAAELENTGVPYAWYFFMTSKCKKENKYRLFFIEMLDMIKSNCASFYNTSFIVYKKAFSSSQNAEYISSMHRDFLEKVLLKIDHYENNDVYDFPFQSIAFVFEKKQFEKKIGRNISKWYRQNKKNMKHSSEYNELKYDHGIKSLKKNLLLWEKYAQRDKKTSTIYTCVRSVYYSNYVEIHTVLGAMCSNKQIKRSDVFFNDRNDPLFVLTPAFKLIDNSKISVLPSLTSAISRGIANPSEVGKDLKNAFRSL